MAKHDKTWNQKQIMRIYDLVAFEGWTRTFRVQMDITLSPQGMRLKPVKGSAELIANYFRKHDRP